MQIIFCYVTHCYQVVICVLKLSWSEYARKPSINNKAFSIHFMLHVHIYFCAYALVY